MAAPHVSGTVALLLQQNPNLTPIEIKARLISTANTSHGHPILDVKEALCEGNNDCIHDPSISLENYPFLNKQRSFYEFEPEVLFSILKTVG